MRVSDYAHSIDRRQLTNLNIMIFSGGLLRYDCLQSNSTDELMPWSRCADLLYKHALIHRLRGAAADNMRVYMHNIKCGIARAYVQTVCRQTLANAHTKSVLLWSDRRVACLLGFLGSFWCNLGVQIGRVCTWNGPEMWIFEKAYAP